jgi:arylsulfatase A-like enzyme
VLITLDTTRADALGCYGGPAGLTPNLDALAGEGVLYLRARATAPLTMPSHSSMLTGLYPIRHTVRSNSLEALPESALTLAELARGRGVATAAFVAAVVLSREFGLAQGFDVYDQPERPALQTELFPEERAAEAVAGAAIAWIEARDRERPFFLWVHFFDPHLPYEAPDELVRLAGGNRYHAEVARMDRAIGGVLDALKRTGAYDETLVIAVADHGEMHGEHGEETHGLLVYEPVIRVPMILRDPSGARAGERSDEIVSIADVYPTIAEGLGLGAPRDVDGLSLFRRRVPAERGVYFESYYGFFAFGWSHLAGWADRRGKLIQSSDPELYDVAADPGEARNLIAQRAGEAAASRAEIAALARRPALVRTGDDEAAQALTDLLAALGYAGVGSGGEDPLDPLARSDRPNPRDRTTAHGLYLRAHSLRTRMRFDEAAQILAGVVRENPLHASAWAELSTCYVKLSRFDEGIAAARRALAVGCDWYGPHENLGVAYDNQERYSEAVEQYKAVLAAKPGHAEVRDRLVLLLRHLGREDEARRFAAQAGR